MFLKKWTFPLFNIYVLLFNEWAAKENWKASILMNHMYLSISRNFLKWEFLGREKKSCTLEHLNHQDPTKTILDLSSVWERGNLWPNESSPVPTTIWKCFSRNCSLRVWKAEEMIFMIVLGLHKDGDKFSASPTTDSLCKSPCRQEIQIFCWISTSSLLNSGKWG